MLSAVATRDVIIEILANSPSEPGVSNLLVSLHYPGRRRVVLGHILNTLQCVIIQKSHNVLSKFTTLCWPTFTAILGPVDKTMGFTRRSLGIERRQALKPFRIAISVELNSDSHSWS